LTTDCHPVVSKSRRHSFDDSRFIEEETWRLLQEGIIEQSNSPWRAQVVVTKDENHKKRLAIDHSETINRFILLDGYPLPRIDDTVNKIAQYRVFSSTDLCSEYHQIRIKDEDKPYTAFESSGSLSISLLMSLSELQMELRVFSESWTRLSRKKIFMPHLHISTM